MWWSCFSWDKKGPYHIWTPETDQQRKEADVEITKIDVVLEPIKRQEWKAINTNANQVKPGKKPAWRWSQNTRKLERGSKGGIDWWRHQNEVLIPKLIPFAQELEQQLNDDQHLL